MDLCIKPIVYLSKFSYYCRFNPCFNGSMYKTYWNYTIFSAFRVSILVLMDLCIKLKDEEQTGVNETVSILVLMDLCIKHYLLCSPHMRSWSFNPCFNGSMYKTHTDIIIGKPEKGFNPCFNGSMYKTLVRAFSFVPSKVSILVLMDLCIKLIYFVTLYVSFK